MGKMAAGAAGISVSVKEAGKAHMKKTIIFIAGIFLLITGAFIYGTVFAKAETVDSGSFGDSITWTLDDEDTLTFSGYGEMVDGFANHALNKANWPTVKKIVIGEGITRIGNGAFAYCPVEEVVFPESLTCIGREAFYHCKYLNEVHFPAGLKRIEYAAFYYSRLFTLELPDGLEHLGDNAFSGNEFKTVVVPDSVTEFGCAFSWCDKLVSIKLPNSIQTVPSFRNCCSLYSIYIPDGVRKIVDAAFQYCWEIRAVRLPESLKEIGGRAFVDSYKLEDVYYAGSEESWNKMIGIEPNPFTKKAAIHFNSLGFITDPARTKKITFHVGSAKEADQDLGFDVTWDDELFDRSAYSYSENLAVVGAALSGSAEAPDGGKRVEDTLHSFGIEKVGSSYYDIEQNFLQPAATFAYKKVVINGEEKNLFVIVVRGTVGNSQDLLTDFSSIAGGFGMSAQNVKERFEEYIYALTGVTYDEFENNSKDNILFITGHSLGGAVANHLASDFSGFAPEEKTFVYTFAAPQSYPVTDVFNVDKNNVFNIINVKDSIPYLPPIGYYRTGKNLYFSSENKTIQNNFAKLTSGVSYQDSCNKDPLWTAHYIETYMAYLLSKEGVGSARHNIRVLGVECPVDLEIYNSNRELAAKITDNTVDTSVTQQLFSYIDGDKKYVILDSDETYSIRLTGTNSGEMTLFIEDRDAETGEVVSEQAFNEVLLENGKTMIIPAVEPEHLEEIQLFVTAADESYVSKINHDGSEASLLEPEIPTESSTIVSESDEIEITTDDPLEEKVESSDETSDSFAEAESKEASNYDLRIPFIICFILLILSIVANAVLLVLLITRRQKK